MLDDSRSNPAVDYVYTDDEIKSARNKLWEMGNLYWKLQPTQRKMYDFFNENPSKVLVMNCSRRLGKTTLLLIMAVEKCLTKPGAKVKFIQPEVGMIRKNVRSEIDQLFIDCPAELRPEFRSQENVYYFKNGSELQFAGTDNGNYMKLRGSNCDLALVDEAGFCTDLDHIIRFILMPTTLLTKGKILLSSTTPPDPNHDFITYMKDAEPKGNLIKKTIVDAMADNMGFPGALITPEIVEQIVSSTPGGRESDSFRTEFMCQLIYNSDSAVVPEFTPEVEEDVVKMWRRPPFCDQYVAMDIGFVDMTAVLFGYYDFPNAVLVIEDEILLKGKDVTAARVSELVSEKEKQLWTSTVTGEFNPPYKRVSDNNLIFLNDLNLTHGLWFLPTEKHDKNSYINKMRTMVSERRIIINPKCHFLIADLKNAMWDKTKKDFKRGHGTHSDALAALAYLVRNLDENRNPFPANYRFSGLGSNPDKVFYSENYYKNSGNSSGLADLANKMKPKSSFRKK